MTCECLVPAVFGHALPTNCCTAVSIQVYRHIFSTRQESSWLNLMNPI